MSLSQVPLPAVNDDRVTATGQAAGRNPIVPHSARGERLARGLAWADALVILALYCWLVVRVVASSWTAGRFADLLILLTEGMVVLFVLIRRPASDISRHPGEWALALGATCFPLLVNLVGKGDAGPLVAPVVGAGLILTGLVIQALAKLTLGRSFGIVPAHRGLKVKGPYRFLRHPVYAGYLLSHLGFLLLNPTPWNFAIYAFSYGLQIPRLLAEERLLSRDPQYQAYQAVVPYRLIPGLF
jgi:protein-S-isoprenylcysteine O-methyltransferase Ste14